MVRALLLDKKGQSPAPVKAVEESCVTCGGAHSYRNCPATDGNNYRDNIQEFVSQASANKQFFGHDKEDPHAHVRYFNKITSTLKFPNVPNTSIKHMLFPFSLEGAARIWLEKEPPRSIFTWDDLVLKFINQFFPPSRTTNLRNEITNFQQWFDESFSEAWDRFKDLLRACPHHGFSELHQLDTFYNALNSKDQDSLNSAKKGQSPAPVKAVEENCVTCGGAHSYKNYPTIDGNNYRDKIQEFVSQAFAVNFNQGNTPATDGNNYRDNIQEFVSQASTVNFNQGNIGVSKEDFSAYVKANDAVMRNIQRKYFWSNLSIPSLVCLWNYISFNLFEFESNNNDVYNDPFDFKEDKLKESKLLIDELDLPRSIDFLPFLEYDSFLFEDFSEVDALPSTDNEDKVFNPGILIQENLSEDFNPPLSDHELPFHKEVPRSETLLSFSSENEEKVFKPEILTSKGVHTSLLPELSHRGPKAFKVIKIFESPMEIFLALMKRTSIFWMFSVSISIPHEQPNSGLGQAK
uniref:Reverse transcriptase domain-containing protein n=1 Tax=Tanacetum cinerariifolium TaxID=118510 RepID=A0A6L2MIA7_TANCI|nr:reverse transcriptase domain-containing protein [Tanacetum cinerariifolium]